MSNPITPCPATAKTREILHQVVAAQAKSIAGYLATESAKVAELATNLATPGNAAKLAVANEGFAKALKLQERVDRVLGNTEDDTGTRNSAGGTIKAIRKFTGRDVIAEAMELWSVAEETIGQKDAMNALLTAAHDAEEGSEG